MPLTYLCVPIFARDAEQVRSAVSAAVHAGAEMIELRLDTLPEGATTEDVTGVIAPLSAARVPWIATCRPAWEGGNFAGSEECRIAILSAASAAAPFVDVELAAEDALAGGAAKRIVSTHDFRGRPERMHQLLVEISLARSDVQKIVWMARSVRDNLEAFEILGRATKPTIALCMGEAGIISRILAGKFGAFLTFASLDPDSATAPGQVSIEQMRDLYRWHKVHAGTKVYGVVASPVGHSMSPAIHNAAFDAAGHDGVYVPLLVQPGYESFKAFMETFVSFKKLDLSGLSVTLPHKENALRYLQEKGAAIEELAARIGAVNTIVIDRSGAAPRLSGLNTDYAAILDSITDALGCGRVNLSGLSVAVLGAGGTGRTAVAALAHCGAKVIVYNRTPSKAAALANDFPGVVCEPWENLHESNCRVYLNTTSVGMHPKVGESPFGATHPKLDANSVVFDTIYNPIQTRLLSQAQAAGAKTISGVEMFVKQAAAQFTAWTGKPAPADVMRKVVELQLQPS